MGIIINYSKSTIWTQLKSLTPPLRKSLARPALVEVSPRSRSNSLAPRTELSSETSRDQSERETTSPSLSVREKLDVSAEHAALICVMLDRPLSSSWKERPC